MGEKKLVRVINGRAYYYESTYYKKPETERDIEEKRVRKRRCLKCDSMFKSDNRFNRICKDCKTTNDSYHFVDDGGF